MLQKYGFAYLKLCVNSTHEREMEFASLARRGKDLKNLFIEGKTQFRSSNLIEEQFSKLSRLTTNTVMFYGYFATMFTSRRTRFHRNFRELWKLFRGATFFLNFSRKTFRTYVSTYDYVFARCSLHFLLTPYLTKFS